MITTDTEIAEKLVSELVEEQKAILLYNDDVNTFEYVISTLVVYCDHDPEQATQCAYIVHNNGKCSVKVGSLKKLKPICNALRDAGLIAQIK